MDLPIKPGANQVADVVFVIEGTANLGPYFESLRKHYILPAIEYFNGGPPAETDFGGDYGGTQYGLVVFNTVDCAPESYVQCHAPTSSAFEFVSWIDSIQFMGGGAESCSLIAEGLSVALQLFDDFKKMREQMGVKTKCNSQYLVWPPAALSTAVHLLIDCTNCASSCCEMSSLRWPWQNTDIPVLQEITHRMSSMAGGIVMLEGHVRMSLQEGYHMREEDVFPVLLHVVCHRGDQLSVLSPCSAVLGISQYGHCYLLPWPHLQSSCLLAACLRHIHADEQRPWASFFWCFSESVERPLYHVSIDAAFRLDLYIFLVQVRILLDHILVSSNPRESSQMLADQSGIDPLKMNAAYFPVGLAPSILFTMFHWQRYFACWVISNMEKPKASSMDSNTKLTRSLPCQVQVNQGENLNADQWPQKLIMQLIPQQLLTTLGPLFRNSRMVQFLFTNKDVESLKGLYRIMATGFAGCVHFPHSAPCEVRVLMLLYSSKKRIFMGLIPNDQSGFVNGIRQVITNHKQVQQHRSLGSGGPMPGPPGQVQPNQNFLNRPQGPIPVSHGNVQQQMTMRASGAPNQQPPVTGAPPNQVAQGGQAPPQGAMLRLPNPGANPQLRSLLLSQQQPQGGVGHMQGMMPHQGLGGQLVHPTPGAGPQMQAQWRQPLAGQMMMAAGQRGPGAQPPGMPQVSSVMEDEILMDLI
ncbi:unnamed protein product [Oncorhynchus mykiss]|uniref:Mediator of RNA polymerase II transcription subunit 25 n=2 Tax=Salmoninae TaxID=504568 RepID=A0A060YCT3_ONCMY|nr:unnamed protein product [Oncorhynchus mykiss]